MLNTTSFQTKPIHGYSQLGWPTRIGYALTRLRFQLGGGILLAVAAPIVARANFEQFADSIAHFQNSIIGTLSGLLLGFLIFRKIAALPGPGAYLRVVPAFLLSYAVVAVFFFALRLEYSRAQFLISLILCISWFIIVLIMMQYLRKPSMALVLGGYADKLANLKSINWLVVASPADADKFPRIPLVIDFKGPELSSAWERYVAEQAISGRSVFNAKGLSEDLTGRVQLEHLSENTFGHLSPDSIYSPMKLYLDVIAAVFALILLLPLLLLVALAIKLTSPGPVIFKQKRMGYRGKEFTLWKFRSMRELRSGKATLEADMTKTDDDRITAVGRVIRKTRIDELPQIFNILRGEMSWIGPRPETIRLSKWYEGDIPFYRYRHIVRPGITGWAQVEQGHITSVGDARTKLEYDLFYVKRFSIWLDILIVMKTVRVIFTGDGAK